MGVRGFESAQLHPSGFPESLGLSGSRSDLEARSAGPPSVRRKSLVSFHGAAPRSVFEANAPRRSRLLLTVFRGRQRCSCSHLGRGHRVFENAEVGDFLAATRICPGHSLPGVVGRVHLIARRQFCGRRRSVSARATQAGRCTRGSTRCLAWRGNTVQRSGHGHRRRAGRRCTSRPRPDMRFPDRCRVSRSCGA